MKRIDTLVLVFCLLVLLLPIKSDAYGSATDTLTVQVGYFGMEDEEYVTVGTWTAEELETQIFAGQLHKVAYSFLKDKTNDKSYDASDGDYQVVIYSAYGFYLTDLLDFCNINYGDIRQLNFCTWDQETGYFASFSAEELFGTQYYFDDLPAHILTSETDSGTVLLDGNAWDYCTQVEPMLALEVHSDWFEPETSHVSPNFENMSTSDRFRLLFGQHNPLEGDTRRTAKYTHTVLVMLEGKPKVTEELSELEGKIGAHVASMTISCGNLDILSNLQQLIRFSSSDDSVVRIDGVTVKEDDLYGDLTHIEVSYTVLKEGQATVSASIGSLSLSEGGQKTVVVGGTEKTQPAKENRADDTGGKEGTSSEESFSEKNASQESTSESGQQTETAATVQATEIEIVEDKQETKASTVVTAQESSNAEHKQMNRLSGNIETILQQLGSDMGDPGDIPQTQTDSEPTVQPEDNTDTLLITLACTLLLLIMGGIFEWIRFRRNHQ